MGMGIGGGPGMLGRAGGFGPRGGPHSGGFLGGGGGEVAVVRAPCGWRRYTRIGLIRLAWEVAVAAVTCNRISGDRRDMPTTTTTTTTTTMTTTTMTMTTVTMTATATMMVKIRLHSPRRWSLAEAGSSRLVYKAKLASLIARSIAESWR
ncbi:uncharacterized protein LOC120357054 [Solenopsis invicta]|uniref:uncharacterized protein LOC120357054 n=1 Tax=Solenopsis invicta TaxID=13686 RepID=UPI00193DD7C8|nr:uncharacterized protein LOC120357054 [Solenopsis invicta]